MNNPDYKGMAAMLHATLIGQVHELEECNGKEPIGIIDLTLTSTTSDKYEITNIDRFNATLVPKRVIDGEEYIWVVDELEHTNRVVEPPEPASTRLDHVKNLLTDFIDDYLAALVDIKQCPKDGLEYVNTYKTEDKDAVDGLENEPWQTFVVEAAYYGKTPDDVCDWWAYDNLEAIREMDDSDLIEYLRQPLDFSVQGVMNDIKDIEPDDMEVALGRMKQFFGPLE